MFARRESGGITLLVRHLDQLVTCDDDGRELADVDIRIEGPMITEVGSGLTPYDDEQFIDGTGLIALPGLINTHHHLYQGALRALPELDQVRMEEWLTILTARSLTWWREGGLNPQTIRVVARGVLLESLLGGVTTVADQHYFFPGGGRSQPFIEATIEASREVGIRLHACRGSLTLGRSRRGSVEDVTVQGVDEVMRHSQELIERFHDPSPFAMVRIALAPTGVHVDAPELFEEMAALAEEHEGVRLHTHLYHRIDDRACRDLYGISPWRFLDEHGWAGPRSWFAHVVDPPAEEIREFADGGVGVSHIIACDFRHGWGLAPLRDFLDQGVTVGFATTGSASNDGSNLLGDLRLAALAHRIALEDPARWPTARELIRVATRGSAACLGRPDLGAIAPGMAADIACWDMRGIDRIGIHDPVTGLLLTGLSDAASLVIVNGEVLVQNGMPTRIDLATAALEARAATPALA